MASRHVHTQRLMSGIIFSAPGDVRAVPEGGWGEDTPMPRSKKRTTKIGNRGIDQFPRWMANVALHEEAHDNHSSFAPTRAAHFMNIEHRPSSVPQYPEPSKRLREPEISEVTLCLPVLSVSLTATVEGTVTHTELVQKFHNTSDVNIDATKHVFPLYDRAVITSFECTIGDERRVRGVVKPKAQARKEFEEAVRDKVTTPALLEEHTPEIFETSLGNIPANTTVEVKLTYIQELKIVIMKSHASEGIALTIPMSIAPRYSKTPIEWEPVSRVPEGKLDIWIKVMDDGRIHPEGCDEESGHHLSKPSEHSYLREKDASSKAYYVWHHVSEPAVLRKDFVFVIQMNEGHQIKSRAIACPSDDNGLAAMMVNIRPNDLFRSAIIPQSFTGEILFLLDQSSSMGWTNGSPDYGRRSTGARKIELMREAMLLALSGIPSTCVFNVISWGSATMGLWESSRPHTKENIRQAKGYVSQVEADMGGTDLLRALKSTLKRRVQDRGSTQIIILTDGELEPEDSIQFIWKKRQLFGDSIRFFALGIGDEVSHRLVESIAEYGGGYSDVVHTTQTPRWHDRLNRLLKSALEPNSWSCDIDLGSGFERKRLVDHKLEPQTTGESDKTPYIQAPFPISSLHPFIFASISFLIDVRHGGELPKTVTISTTTAGAKKRTYKLPIEQAPGNDGTIHRLVAKSVLLDLQNEIKRGTIETQIAKENAEHIGTKYSITSKWTSFVAVSENQPAQTVEEQKMNHYKALFDEMDIDELLNNVSDDETSSCGSSSGSAISMAYGPLLSAGRSRMSGPLMSHEVPGPSPYEDLDSSGSIAPAASDVRIPTRERVQDSSPDSIYADIRLYPNDSDWHEATRLDRTRADTTDDSQSDLPPPIEEYTLARHVAAGAAKPPTDESYAQEAPTPRGSESAYPEPSALEDGQPSSAGPYVPPAPLISSPQLLSPWPNVTSTSVIVRETVGRRRKCAQAIVDDDGSRDEVSELSSSKPKGLPIETCGDESYSSEAGKERVSTHSPDISSNPMPHTIRSSLDEDESLDGNGTDRFHLNSPPAQYRRPGQAPLPQAYTQLNPHSSAGLQPQSVRESVPGGPKFPTYKAMPIPRTRARDFFGPIGRSAKQRRGASKRRESDYDSDDSSVSRHTSESSPSSPNVYGPLDWQFAMECQDGQSLFDLDEKRPSLHLHFCPETVAKFGPKISELLSNSSTPEEERDDVSARLLDTLMMIECYRTHRAQEEDTWDLMMERAWDAVISALGLADEEERLEELASQLRGAMMHAHYVAATGVKESDKDDSSVETVRCPACDMVWLTTRKFFCPFDHESDDVDEFASWDDFWKHQVDQGHAVCPREVMG
ncbi:hypothetical protein FPANT_6860 [Fusarium pseudoanthophilum]|uniref:Uncharacterized protein n=1 Tax=Fusarium pseudoanthophilum TaxID=48495 RepID=A0A8H5P5M7_9HYPO|nr:hypothetical protein FPANT_6860 [Fusarium pseudoanthophilum]